MTINLSPLIRAVSKTVPLLGAALAGPAGSVVGELLATMFGGDIAKPEELAKIISADPDAQAKLLAVTYSHEEALEALKVKDRDSARGREIGLIDKLGRRDWIVPILAILVTLGFFGCIGCVLVLKLDTTDHDVLNVLCGVLGTSYISIIAYYFGATHQIQSGKSE